MANDVPDWTSVSLVGEKALTGSPFTVARDGLVHDLGSVNLVQGTKALCFVTNPMTAIQHLSCVGSVTGFDYGVLPPSGAVAPAYVRMLPVIDPAVDIKVTTDAAGGNITLGIAFILSDQLSDLDSIAIPPSAQAIARAIGINATGTTNLTGVILGRTPRLHSFGFMVIGQSSGVTTAFIEDATSGNSLCGHSFSGVGSSVQEGVRNAAPADAAGHAFQLHVTSLGAGAGLNMWAAYTFL